MNINDVVGAIVLFLFGKSILPQGLWIAPNKNGGLSLGGKINVAGLSFNYSASLTLIATRNTPTVLAEFKTAVLKWRAEKDEADAAKLASRNVGVEKQLTAANIDEDTIAKVLAALNTRVAARVAAAGSQAKFGASDKSRANFIPGDAVPGKLPEPAVSTSTNRKPRSK